MPTAPTFQDRIGATVASFRSYGWETDIPARSPGDSDGEYLSVLRQKLHSLKDQHYKPQPGDIGYRHPHPPSQIEWDGDH